MHSLSRTTDNQDDERERINENGSDAVAHDDKILCNPCFSSLLNARRTSVRFLHMLSEDAKQMTIRLTQEADGVGLSVTMHAVLEAVLTPPQVDISLCRHVRIKTGTCAIRTWERRTYSLLAVSRLRSISPSKKDITPSFPSLLASSVQRDTTSLWLFSWLASDDADCSISPTCMSLLLFEQISARVHLLCSSVSSPLLCTYLKGGNPKCIHGNQLLPQQRTISTALLTVFYISDDNLELTYLSL